MTIGAKGDRLARAVGLVVFLAGLCVIGCVLRLALRLFEDPDLGARIVGHGVAAPAVADIGIGFGRLIMRIVLLLLGSLCGWFIAGRGVGLYLAGCPSGHTASNGEPGKS
jgi:hypothetical protein